MKEKYQKFLLFSFVFFLGIFLFLLKPQTIFSDYYCNNGPNKNDGGGCGTPCHCGKPWTQYIKGSYGSEFCEIIGTTKYFVKMVSELCPTGDVCILGEKGLRYGTCDCGFGSIYKMCCVGSTPVNCIRYGDPKWKRGTCPSGSTIVRGTSCPVSCSDTRTCGQKCSAAGCAACACDGDSRSSSYNWTSLGCSRDCGTCYCGKPKCTCSGWTARGCGGGSCGSLQRLYTRDCNPDGCQNESKCENDSSCCICSGWVNGACNAAGSCPIGQRRQTRTCDPSGCSTTSRCITDSSCNCVCDWTDVDCGPSGGCALNRMYQTGVCNYPDCATTQCVVHPNCVSSCTMTLSPSPLNVGLDKSRLLTANVEVQHATVSQVSFVSADSGIASVNPASDSNSPYVTTVYGRALGSTRITATSTLSPEGSCTTSVDVTVRPTAWFQTQGGDIYTGASLSSDIPSTADDLNFSTKLDNWPGIITHQDSDGINLGDGYSSNDTAYHWLAESKHEGKPYGSFQFFKKKFTTEMVSETYGLGRGDLPVEDGVYYAQSSRTLSGSSWNVGNNRWVVLLVEGDVNINSNIRLPKGSFLAIAATGDINFGDGVGQAHGVFVADGTISTGVGDEEFKGEGVFAAGSFDLGRDFEDERNDTIPIEFFKARPDFIMSSYRDADNNLWWFFHKWQEIAP
jgi:hypothetical protein